MKNIQRMALGAFATLLAALSACNDPTAIGSDLLSGDQLDLDFTDTVSLFAYVEKRDSAISYDPQFLLADFDAYPLGDYVDPIFGKAKATIATQYSLTTTLPKFADATVDSVVFILPYKTGQEYGKVDELFHIELRELAEVLDRTEIYYTTQNFDAKDLVIGSADFIPNLEDSVEVIIPQFMTDTLTEVLPAQLRIRMTDEFAQRIFADTANLKTDSLFSATYKGLVIQSGASKGMLSFNLRSAAAGMKVYYHKDTVYSQYTFPIFGSDVIASHFEHDYTNSIAANILEAPVISNDEILLLQGLNGLYSVVELPFIDNLDNIIINKAELVFTILDLPEDDGNYDPIRLIIASEMVSDTSSAVISDVLYSVNRLGAGAFYELAGGDLETDGTYKLNITSHILDMIRGDATKKLIINVQTAPENPHRVTIGGPGHPAAPLKLNISYTRF